MGTYPVLWYAIIVCGITSPSTMMNKERVLPGRTSPSVRDFARDVKPVLSQAK